MTISIKDFDNQEVCIWLNAIGLGSKVGPFRDNAVDGDLLCSLSQEDLTNDLGLSGLQAKKVLRGIEAETNAAGGSAVDSYADAIKHLEEENAHLRQEINSIKARIEKSQGSQMAPPPQQYHPPPPQQQQQRHHSPPPPQQHHHDRGPGVVGGAARGALGGAAKGAIAGAILPGMSAADGAAAGAAVGAATGGARGLGNRLGRRL